MSDRIDREWEQFADAVLIAAEQQLQELVLPLNEKRAAEPKVVAGLLFLRTLSNYKAGIQLIKCEMYVEARIILRCCVENLIVIGGVSSSSDDFVQHMLLDDVKSKQKIASMIEGMNNLDANVKERIAANLKRLLGIWPKPRFMNFREVAERGPLGFIYLLYSQLSADAAHPTITALNRYLTKGTVETEIDASAQPSIAERRMTLEHLCAMMLGVCIALNEIAGPMAVAKSFAALADQLNSLKERSAYQ